MKRFFLISLSALTLAASALQPATSAAERYIKVGESDSGLLYLDTASIAGTRFKLMQTTPAGKVIEVIGIQMACAEKMFPIVLPANNEEEVTGKWSKYQAGSPIGSAMAISCRKIGATGY